MTSNRSELGNFFVRGAVAAALLSALQQQTSAAKGKKSAKKLKKVLRHAMQGGFATAAGMGVANAIEQQQYQQALLLLLGGGIGIASSEWLIKD